MKPPPNWVEYDKQGKAIASRHYATGGIVSAEATRPIDVVGACINEERGHAAHRRVTRGVVAQQDTLL